jgi:hypothetical protein
MTLTPESKYINNGNSRPSSIALSDRLTLEDTTSFDGWDNGEEDVTPNDNLLDTNDGWGKPANNHTRQRKAHAVLSFVTRTL